ncbi:acyltransferase [Pedobacter sp. PF22-3]|uniref:acyltransferase family protein n=1 Tax=Pedobacter sp. PF22-3 TaxID=2994467 RepID=UPI002247E8C4|nr:acyltransferase [Pedobacter sp. PF22-3]MCX2495839.1 acyltransferase [Pedobacter sp. PF22-3]
MNIELTQKATPEKKNFDFVDTIRCISMMGIVLEHCGIVPPNHYANQLDSVFETSIIQFFKFSTIAFFLIGGFLINHKFQEYTPFQYLKNRFKKTIGPWLFWICVLIMLSVLDRFIAHSRGSAMGLIGSNFFLYFYETFIRIVLISPYWFILNFLICITILLIFKRYLYNIWFGLVLASFSLFYSVNIYQGWIATTHTTAIFGFVFYLWLGVYFNAYYDKIMGIIKRTSWIIVLFLAFVTFCIAVGESTYLNSIGIKDAYNTLRVSNIVYSLVMFALLLKMGSLNWLRKHLQPRETTFGIYLIHVIIIDRGLPLIFQPLKLNFLEFSVWLNTAILLFRFLVTYVVSFFLAKAIGKTKMKWIVGN